MQSHEAQSMEIDNQGGFFTLRIEAPRPTCNVARGAFVLTLTHRFGIGVDAGKVLL